MASLQPQDLAKVLEELAQREPIFHRPAFGRTREDWERLMVEDYWEVGASGQRYDRNFILRHLTDNPPLDADIAGWRTSEFNCRPLGPDTYLLTYILDQSGRVTRRATLWKRSESDWQILFHQGTVVELT